MNKNKLKSYAPATRRAFIQAVTDRAHFWGLGEKGSESVEERSDIAIIGGRAFPRKVATQIKGLAERIKRDGFDHVMEAVAYTWFNRFMAIRYMEIHGYFEHGFRVLSSPNNSPVPQILEQVTHVKLSGLNQDEMIALKLDGTKDAELYRMLLVAQCNALHEAMPFLFEKIDDETELLLPDNLLHSDSLIRKLVTEIDEDDWQEVEIIGWLYQFYISEKKDQVIGKVVKSEDIPAATQLFTPNWIVKYMVQNSLGRMWLATYPNSPLRQKMEYYIEPAEQTDEVKAQLAAITPDSLDPEAITFMDPANGSGHILVEAYDLLKEMYMERGYSSREFPRLILEKNLYGLDIDDRAAQMAGFALLMKARKDDRQILQGDNPVKLNVMAIQDSGEWTVDSGQFFSLSLLLGEGKVSRQDITDLVDLFKYGKTFGSLITVREALADKLPSMARLVEENLAKGDLFAQRAAMALLPIIKQAEVLAKKYDCVVANPPYMGSKGMNIQLKGFAKEFYPNSKSDLFAMFIERTIQFLMPNGLQGMITMHSWMFLSSFIHIREKLLDNKSIITMAHLGARAFSEISGEVVQTTVFIIFNQHLRGYKPSFFRLVDGQEEQKRKALQNRENLFSQAIQDSFKKIPGNSIAYWVKNSTVTLFEQSKKLLDVADFKTGITTGDNIRFMRFWYEVPYNKIQFGSFPNEKINHNKKWIPCKSGGDYRKWYGCNIDIINWENDGFEIKNFFDENGNRKSTIRNESYMLRESLTWSKLSTNLNVRWSENGFLFDAVGLSVFADKQTLLFLIGLLNTKNADYFINIFNSSMSILLTDLGNIPFPLEDKIDIKRKQQINESVESMIKMSKFDWDSIETSWNFKLFPWLTSPLKNSNVDQSWQNWQNHCAVQLKRMQELETENNRIFIEAYGLQDELTPEVPDEQITLARANREQDMKRLISYAIGCMMGRYRLDRPGLIYAHSGNDRFWDIYGQVDSEQWLVDSNAGRKKGGEDGGAELSGFDRLAEGDGSGRADLSGNKAVSKGGVLRSDEPDQKGGSFDTIEYSGRSGEEVNSGVPQLSVNCSGIASGSGDTTPDSNPSQLFHTGTGNTNSLVTGRTLENALISPVKASLTTNHCPLTTIFPPDDDGIIPVMDVQWFPDDAASRFEEFLKVAWSPETLEENLKFVADSLSPRSGETPRETIRRYISTQFFKDHLQIYKKRPIYWLFSSGKLRAFECLIYLHRYNEATLSRMRNEYVTPLHGKLSARVEYLAHEIDSASTTSARNKLQKELDTIKKKQAELSAFDDLLRHYADKRISLDLDDGVKVNYSKFGNLLAEFKTVTGGME